MSNSTNGTDLWEDGAQQMTHDFAGNILGITIVLGIFSVIGFFGNLCVFIVYQLKYPRCNFKYFVICLAIIDMTSSLTTIPGEIYVQRNWFNFPKEATWLCKIKTYFNGFTVFVSAFFLLLIAIDRFRKVCRPLAWQIKPKRAIHLCLLIFGIAILLAIPSLVLWGEQTELTTYQDRTVFIQMCGKNDAYKKTIWPTIYLYFIFFTPTLGYMISTSVLYGMIMRVIFFGSLAKKNISSSSQRGPKAFAMKTTSSTDDSRIREDSENTLESDDMIESDNDSDGGNRRGSAITTKKVVDNSISYVSKRNKAKEAKVTTARKRLRRKTMIMFVLTVVFLVTTVVYFGILTVVVRNDHNFILVSKTSVFMLFLWRLYLVNHIINPIVYGVMDPRFRAAVKELFCSKCNCLQ